MKPIYACCLLTALLPAGLARATPAPLESRPQEPEAATARGGADAVPGGTAASPAAAPPVPPAAEGSYVVTRVLDGATLALDDGRKVRLLGVEAPRVPAAAAPATDTLRRLAQGKRVRLDFDEVRADAAGATLAYVRLDGGKMLLNEEMIRRGYGFASGAYPCRYLRVFQDWQRLARDSKLGAWRLPPGGKAPPPVPAKVRDYQQRVEEVIALIPPPGTRLPGQIRWGSARQRGTTRLFLIEARKGIRDLAAARGEESSTRTKLDSLRRKGFAGGAEYQRLQAVARKAEARQIAALERVLSLCRDSDVDPAILVKVSALALDVSEGRRSGASAMGTLSRLESGLR